MGHRPGYYSKRRSRLKLGDGRLELLHQAGDLVRLDHAAVEQVGQLGAGRHDIAASRLDAGSGDRHVEREVEVLVLLLVALERELERSANGGERVAELLDLGLEGRLGAVTQALQLGAEAGVARGLLTQEGVLAVENDLLLAQRAERQTDLDLLRVVTRAQLELLLVEALDHRDPLVHKGDQDGELAVVAGGRLDGQGALELVHAAGANGLAHLGNDRLAALDRAADDRLGLRDRRREGVDARRAVVVAAVGLARRLLLAAIRLGLARDMARGHRAARRQANAREALLAAGREHVGDRQAVGGHAGLGDREHGVTLVAIVAGEARHMKRAGALLTVMNEVDDDELGVVQLATEATVHRHADDDRGIVVDDGAAGGGVLGLVRHVSMSFVLRKAAESSDKSNNG